MPIFMDRHDVSDEVTAENVAQLHQEDLKIQDKFNCRGLTYWFDGVRKTAFCLVEAPNKEALKKMHDHAHGEVPHRIIEVDETIVESFLGRIEDPEKSKNTALNIINDPAFRILLVTGIKRNNLKGTTANEVLTTIKMYNKSIIDICHNYDGRFVKQEGEMLLMSFKSVSKAVTCALTIQSEFEGTRNEDFNLDLGLSAGVPVTDKNNLFEDTIKEAKQYCEAVKGKIVISSEIKDLYESENITNKLNEKNIRVLNVQDEKFVRQLNLYMEKEWSNTSINIEDFCINMGHSKSQMYRKMRAIIGMSLNSYLKEYRLNKALQLLNRQLGNISQIASETGFNSPAYFSKCFNETFGVLPSKYSKESINI